MLGHTASADVRVPSTVQVSSPKSLKQTLAHPAPQNLEPAAYMSGRLIGLLEKKRGR